MLKQVRVFSSLHGNKKECSDMKKRALNGSDKTVILRNNAKEVPSSVYGVFKYTIIVITISLT